MKKNTQKDDSKICYCKKCKCEIPTSAASTREGSDYIFYFCGDECLKKWEKAKRK